MFKQERIMFYLFVKISQPVDTCSKEIIYIEARRFEIVITCRDKGRAVPKTRSTTVSVIYRL